MFLLQYAGLSALPFDPTASNDALHFNSSNGPLVTECASVENTAGNNCKKRKRTSLPPDGNCNLTMASTSMTMPMSDHSPWATAMSNLGMPPLSMTGQQLMPDFDPSLGLMTGITPINPMMPGLSLASPPLPREAPVVKEIIHCKSCTLFPPNPNLPPPAMRERPPGCKTVFVGGLPENATEQLIVEIFGQRGEIAAIRKSKKNFCHIRFAEEFSVDKALLLSGYHVRLGSSTDKNDSGRLHVDFAQARDDLYEWECRQRLLAREERHRRKIEEDRLRPPSPPPIVHYSAHESSQLGDKIKDDNTFPEAVRVLLTWLERGEVNRRNANNFYSMIQSSNGHIRRLTGEKSQHEKEVEEAKDKFKTAMATILAQFEEIVSVFNAASKQKAWDHFSKAQRKNLDMWRTQVEKIRNMHNEQLMGIRGEEEMEMSDDDMEDSSASNSKDSEDLGVSQAEALKEENDSLRCQLDAYRNEVELLKQEQGKNQPIGSEEDNTHSQQLSFLQQALQGMQKPETLKQDDRASEQTANQDSDVTASSVVSCSQDKESLPEKNRPGPVHTERDALLVGIISTFLHVHPFGASIEYICSYLQRLDNKVTHTHTHTYSILDIVTQVKFPCRADIWACCMPGSCCAILVSWHANKPEVQVRAITYS
ncbi:ecto-NOX disulfide-thiol exchanger 2-like isoform X5 [Anarrhichthys ocellatus]|uniref:ecto-NOX disulfide-thiol exchanger 2-like isoform X5 n=1 Tax=Anarrhichthys ocellatus TaxID=433405 RepID=UPI0012EED626|nr:ecto-NOX disulfide-thiol exchanger 2-like isoform X5 [Anarrhichthys ocellatus]